MNITKHRLIGIVDKQTNKKKELRVQTTRRKIVTMIF